MELLLKTCMPGSRAIDFCHLKTVQAAAYIGSAVVEKINIFMKWSLLKLINKFNMINLKSYQFGTVTIQE